MWCYITVCDSQGGVDCQSYPAQQANSLNPGSLTHAVSFVNTCSKCLWLCRKRMCLGSMTGTRLKPLLHSQPYQWP